MVTVTLQHGDLSVAVLPEEVDYANARLIGAQCEYLVRHGCRTLILDASRARLLDSSAIGMMVRLLRIIGEYRGCLRIAGLGTYYRSVFEVLGVDKVFSLFPTAQAAARGAVSPADAHEHPHEHGTIHRAETQQG
ncbi:STAS domain-containing protein [Streptomyces lavendofoliae]|uniref:STAS domain-containing protein n=1 Tax=Streptomyces lavendofoliae TaxID=67314 RepID=UPI003D8D7771